MRTVLSITAAILAIVQPLRAQAKTEWAGTKLRGGCIMMSKEAELSERIEQLFEIKKAISLQIAESEITESGHSIRVSMLRLCRDLLHAAQAESSPTCLDLRERATELLRALVREYPGSAEAHQADMLLKSLSHKP